MGNLPLAPGQPRETVGNTGYSLARTCGGGESPDGEGWARGLLASWRGNGPPRRLWVAGLRDRPARLGLRHGPDSYGRQQWGILRNGRKPDAATPRAGGRPSGFIGRKALVGGPSGRESTPGAQPRPAPDTGGLESRRGGRNSGCSGGMRRYPEEHRWRRRTSGRALTLRSESWGSEQD